MLETFHLTQRLCGYRFACIYINIHVINESVWNNLCFYIITDNVYESNSEIIVLPVCTEALSHNLCFPTKHFLSMKYDDNSGIDIYVHMISLIVFVVAIQSVFVIFCFIYLYSAEWHHRHWDIYDFPSENVVSNSKIWMSWLRHDHRITHDQTTVFHKNYSLCFLW